MPLRERLTACRRPAGRALLTLAALALAGCEPAKTTSSTTTTGGATPDVTPPVVTSVALGANRDTIDVNSPLNVTVTAVDNKSIRRLDVTIRAGTTQLARDTQNISTGQSTFAKTITVRMTGIAAGTPVRVISVAQDGALNNSSSDTLLLVTKDSVAPTVTLNAPVASQPYRLGDTVKVDVNAADSSGLARVYYSIFRINSPIDTALVKLDSVVPVAGTSTQRTVFPFVYGVAVLPGDYIIRARAVDVSGNGTVVPQVRVLLRDPTPPGLTVSLPGRDTSVTAGDTNFIVTIRATDNISLVRVKAWGVSYKGNAALGRVDTVMRYDTTFVPSSGSAGTLRAGLLDTTVSRRMLATGQGTFDPETVFMFVRATDQSGNDSTLSRRVILTGRAFTQDTLKPRIDTIVPGDLATVTLGSSFTVSARLRDNLGLRRFAVVGITTRGDPALGAVDTTIRYDSVFAPIKSGGVSAFRAGLTDTTITRIMTATLPPGGADTLRLVFRVTDNTGRDSTIIRRVILLSGPTVTLGSPLTGSTTFPGTRIPITVSATGPSRLIELGYRIENSRWLPPIKRIDVSALATSSTSITDTVIVPDTVLSGSLIKVVPLARDVVNPSVTVLGDSASVLVNVPTADVAGPLVFQTIAPRIETNDSLVVRANDPSGIKTIDFLLLDDSLGTTIQSGNVTFAAPFPKDTALRAKITIPLASLGRRYRFHSFATDGLSNRGNALPAGSTLPDSIRADTLRGVLSFGRTFRNSALPTGTLAGDLIVDRRNNAYLSNLSRNQLELWRLNDSTFRPPIFVGSQPWGMTFNRTGDSIFVANSGGTNISVVDTAGKLERRRIKTPANVLYVITQTIDPSSGVTRLNLDNIVQYSDRPQYIAMSANGNLYFSTRPTETAKPGTIRRVDPRQPPASTEAQQVTTYAALGPSNTYVVFNVDSLYITKSAKDSISDNITIFERQYGTTTQVTIGATTALGTYTLGATDSNVVRLCNATLQAANGDCRALQVDVNSLSLTDTTFLAAGGNGKAIAFGEGNVATSAARVMLVIDTAGSWFNVVGSAGVSVRDLTNNASDRVYGLAVDSLSQTVLANGKAAFFSDINASALFNLRLQGSYETSLPGNGVAYHPKAVCSIGGTTSTRVAFVMQGDSTIAIVDCFSFRRFKTIPVRTALYGQIRAVLPTPGEVGSDPTLSVKLYCLTKEGLLVISIRNSELPP
ncbi:MAG: hypothetical protein HYX65_05730 [Gemmatimonadetes bacterium]|nr:hypothetical protein [Gemmatimonadota bacterium]